MKVSIQKIGTLLFFAPFVLFLVVMSLPLGIGGGLFIASFSPFVLAAFVICGLIIKAQGLKEGKVKIDLVSIMLFVIYSLAFLNIFFHFFKFNLSEDNIFLVGLIYLFPVYLHLGVLVTRSFLNQWVQLGILVLIILALSVSSYSEQTRRDSELIKSMTNSDGYIYCETYVKSPLEDGGFCPPYYGIDLQKELGSRGYHFTVVEVVDFVNVHGVQGKTYKIEVTR